MAQKPFRIKEVFFIFLPNMQRVDILMTIVDPKGVCYMQEIERIFNKHCHPPTGVT